MRIRALANRNGFTLIEILIAMVIMAAAIGVCSRQYWSYSQSVRRAEKELIAGRALFRLPELCKRDLEKGLTSGGGTLAKKQGKYRWQAHKISEQRNLTQNRNEKGQLLRGQFVLKLYDVKIEISAASVGAQPQNYNYSELVWAKIEPDSRRGMPAKTNERE